MLSTFLCPFARSPSPRPAPGRRRNQLGWAGAGKGGQRSAWEGAGSSPPRRPGGERDRWFRDRVLGEVEFWASSCRAHLLALCACIHASPDVRPPVPDTDGYEQPKGAVPVGESNPGSTNGRRVGRTEGRCFRAGPPCTEGGHGGATPPFRLRRGCGACRALLRFAEGRVLSCVDFGAGGGPGSLGVRGSIPLSSTNLTDRPRGRRYQRRTARRVALSTWIPARKLRTTARRCSTVPAARTSGSRVRAPEWPGCRGKPFNPCMVLVTPGGAGGLSSPSGPPREALHPAGMTHGTGLA